MISPHKNSPRPVAKAKDAERPSDLKGCRKDIGVLWRMAVVANFALATPIALSQAVPEQSQLIQRSEEQRERLRQQLEPKPQVTLRKVEEAASTRLPAEQACKEISSVRVEPALIRHVLMDEALAGPEGKDSPVGKCIGVEGLRVLVERAQRAISAHGFLTSSVDILPQDLRSGHVVLSVSPGRIGRVLSVQGPESVAWRVATLPIGPGDVLNIREIEQSLENLRRDGSAEVSIQIVPGTSEGLSDIVIDHRNGQLTSLGLSIDDSGSRATGRELVGATVRFNNVLGWSELVYLNLGRNLRDRSEEPRGSNSFTLHADLPLGYWTLSATAGGNRYYQTVVGPFQSYRYSGEASSLDMQIARVIQRDGLGRTTVSLSAFSRESKSWIDDTEIEVQRRRTGGWLLELGRTQRLGEASLDAGIRYRRGTGAFGALPAPEEVFGEGTSRMRVFSANLNLQAPLRIAGWPALASSELRIQRNRSPLTPQDRMCLGGRYTVRGFDEAQAICGPAGEVFRNQLSTSVPGMPYVLYSGLDLGRVSVPADESRSHYTLAGTFAGLRGALPRGSGQWDIFVGIPIKKPVKEAPNRPSVGFQISANL